MFAPVWLLLIFVAGSYWPILRERGAAAILMAAGIACLANYRKNCVYHCRITGLLYLALGALVLLNPIGPILLPASTFWFVALFGTAIALLLEWRHTRAASKTPSEG